MKTVLELLDQKGSRLWSIAPDASVYEALALMAERRIGAVVVIDDTGPIGLLSERDYARDAVHNTRSPKETLVRDIMTRHVVCAPPELTLDQAMAVMTERCVRHLPVLDDGVILGIISIRDIVKSLNEGRRFAVERLERILVS
ncbi:putative signal transduction protein with CBS domains [Thiorhodococcus drewsii AZ1]|uniref:Putative signal transduction protein with CBS domains n=1 Tax=Thiorhodococcus drewsii AZ1 TaxID=765913 RepID=G2DXE2_9GAMM|nr:CBS domain-containing protein [Thiorhodococcus drewsii]EGV33174.1 putative signal transduction protein with CBS domains [Thiorhodococcus drewsii AZ1]